MAGPDAEPTRFLPTRGLSRSNSMRDRQLLAFVHLVVIVLAATVLYACSNPSPRALPTTDPVPERVWAAAWSSTIASSPNGGRFYVANPDSGSVTAVDTATEEAVWEKPVGSHPATVAADIHAEDHLMVGRYAVQFLWSDAHFTGIYPFEMLRMLCQCDECRVGAPS